MKGKVQTVLGLVDPSQLGITLTHEHLLHDLPSNVFEYPRPSCLSHVKLDEKISIENFGWVQRYPYSFEYNKIYSDKATLSAVKEDVQMFKKFGGGTIVDNCSFGLRADKHAEIIQKMSLESGINIVMGTGYYVSGSQSSATLKLTQEQMENQMRTELLDGVAGVKCGVIGEIGCCWPLSDFEKRSLQSSAAVQSETGCPVIIHPGRNKSSPEEAIRIFSEAGGDAAHTVMSHLERTFFCKEDLIEFASLGSFLEFDLFGTEISHYQPNEDVDMPSDAQRISFLHYLVQQGYEDKIVIAHDIHTKHRLMKFGGHGFSHIVTSIIPKMLQRGFTQADVEKISCYNPQTWLSFK